VIGQSATSYFYHCQDAYVSAFPVSNGFLTASVYGNSIPHYFLFVKKRKEGVAFLPDFRSQGILPPIDEIPAIPAGIFMML